MPRWHFGGEGLLEPKSRAQRLVADAVNDLLDKLAAWVPPAPTTKWVEPEGR